MPQLWWRLGNAPPERGVVAVKGLIFMRVLAMSALGISVGNVSRPRTFVVSAAAEVRHEQLFFERQQSLATRDLEWEVRAQPLLSWSTLILRGLLTVAAALLVLVIFT